MVRRLNSGDGGGGQFVKNTANRNRGSELASDSRQKYWSGLTILAVAIGTLTEANSEFF